MSAEERYQAAAHAMQSGVAWEMGRDGPDTGPTSPKHLRVGVNAAMCDQAALVKLLIAKGIITHEEYLEAIAAEMEAEVGRYEARISRATGAKITLG